MHRGATNPFSPFNYHHIRRRNARHHQHGLEHYYQKMPLNPSDDRKPLSCALSSIEFYVIQLWRIAFCLNHRGCHLWLWALTLMALIKSIAFQSICWMQTKPTVRPLMMIESIARERDFEEEIHRKVYYKFKIGWIAQVEHAVKVIYVFFFAGRLQTFLRCTHFRSIQNGLMLMIVN